jgi:hypothetical protein
MTNRQIGEPITTPDGNTYTVNIETWANEAPECITIEGYACLVAFDPGSRSGRAAIRRLQANLTLALAAHDEAANEIYAGLKVGDDTARVRVVAPDEAQCTYPLGDHQCHRVEHDDGHHVAVDGDTYQVIAVAHA